MTVSVEKAIDSLFVSYDGALDPLGASQVVPYLVGLAQHGVRPTLISFEKPERLAQAGAARALQQHLDESNVRWRPLVYHRRPRVPATAWDFLGGVHAIRSEARRSRPQIVHCRGDLAMLMARTALTGSRLLYDPRGLFSEERASTGSWARGGVLDRIVRRVERGNLARADGLVVLTRAVLPQYVARRADLPPHRVIPTCADVAKFTPRSANESPDFGLAYIGSLGTWYLTREMVAFARVAAKVVPGRVLFLTPNVDEARRAGADDSWAEVRSAAPSEVPSWLRRVRALFFFIQPVLAKQASCPTKLAEALAAGLPVLSNTGIGDVDELLQREQVGVLTSLDEASFPEAAERLRVLIETPGIADRCRNVAVTQLSTEAAVSAYHDLYRTIAGYH
jgi:glycosyltransferase involved in cell wall biosynthesis